ncbi:hypothetical protein Tco_0897660, partial [Tanacetum coccineum]
VLMTLLTTTPVLGTKLQEWLLVSPRGKYGVALDITWIRARLSGFWKNALRSKP